MLKAAKKPALTVLMSVFNGQDYLVAAINSVLNQTFVDFEFLIYNDCSTDGSLDLIKKFEDPRIILIDNKENRGLTNNLFDGMNLARGKYLARMDADDICELTRFQEQFDFLEANLDISLLGSSVTFFHNDGKAFIGYQPLTHEEIVVELLFGYTMMHPSVMMRLGDFKDRKLNYDISYRYSQDFDLWVRASNQMKFANLRQPLISMREHTKKVSRDFRPQQKALSDQVRVSQLNKLEVNYTNSEIEAFHNKCSEMYITIPNGLNDYISILSKILKKNKELKLYDHKVLKRGASNRYVEYCKKELLELKSSGLIFWRYLFLFLPIKSIPKMTYFTLRFFIKLY